MKRGSRMWRLETTWDGVGAQGDEGGAHTGQNHNFKIKVTLDSMPPHTQSPSPHRKESDVR